MTKLKYQTDAQIEKTRLAKPEFMKKIDELMAQARDFEKGKNALSVGQIAPNFELPNANQEPISLASLLKKGPVVVTFYRGSWCPYCNLQLKALHSKLADIQAASAELFYEVTCQHDRIVCGGGEALVQEPEFYWVNTIPRV